MTQRPFIALAGFAGAAGVALAAKAAHGDTQYAGQVSTMLLLHAPVFLATGLMGQSVGRFLSIAVWVLAAGLLLFCGDLLARDFLGNRLFPMASPIGGGLMIAGWLGVAASSLLNRA